MSFPALSRITYYRNLVDTKILYTVNFAPQHSKKTMSEQPTKRKVNSKTVFQRIVELGNLMVYTSGTDKDGMRLYESVKDPHTFVIEKYEEALRKTKEDKDFLLQQFSKIPYYHPDEEGDNPESLSSLFNKLLEKYGPCKVLNKDYPVVNFVLKDKKCSEKRRKERKELYDTAQLGLHHIAAVVAAGRKGDLSNIKKNEQGNHLCKNPRCISAKHLTLSSKRQNQANDTCNAWVICDDVLLSSCGCDHQCIVPGLHAKKKQEVIQ